MRITFILPTANISGGARVVAIYAERLRARNHDVLVASAPPRVPPLKRRIKSFILGHGWPTAPKQIPSHFDNVDVSHHIINRYRPITDADVPDADVVVATWWETAEWVANLSTRKGAKVYFIQHHEIHSEQPVERVKLTYRLPFHKITISQWLVDLMRDEYDDADVTHVPNSVDTTMFTAPKRYKQKNATVGMLYSTKQFKGCDVSLKAIEIAQKSNPSLHLISFGEHSPSTGVLPKGSTFIRNPPQHSIRDIYAKCDVWLCGSRAEGFHLPPLEAMACRCPVVSTKVGGPMDIIQNDVNGFIVDVEDYQSLAKGVLEVVNASPQRWLEMSKAAYKTAISYSWDNATEKFEQGLKKAIEKENIQKID